MNAQRRITPVILSGGSGTRLWPVSRGGRPKQLLPLTHSDTMLQLTLGRTGDIARFAAPVIVANALTLHPLRCARCRTVSAAERRELAALRRLCGRRCAIIQTPLSAPPPRGVKALDAWARTWL